MSKPVPGDPKKDIIARTLIEDIKKKGTKNIFLNISMDIAIELADLSSTLFARSAKQVQVLHQKSVGGRTGSKRRKIKGKKGR